MSLTAFRITVILPSVLITASGFVDTLHPSLVDAPLRDIETPFPDLANHWWIGAILLAFVISSITSTIGLLFFKNWARHLAVASTITGLFIYPMLGSTVMSGIASSLHEAGATLWGVVLAISYVGGISSRFRTQ